MQLVHIDDFFAFARTRHEIYLRRVSGAPAPWSNDPIFQTNKFTNIFRELDRTTVWIRENIRDPLDKRVRDGRFSPVALLFGVIASRWFNRTETLAEILSFADEHFDDPLEIFQLHNWDAFDVSLREHLLRTLKTFITAAYMIKTPTGMPKLEGIMEVIRRLTEDRVQYGGVEYDLRELALAMEAGGVTLQRATETLQRFDHLGPFLAYEAVTDLRHTVLLENASDILTWANPGPGAARGIVRIQDRWHDPAMLRSRGKNVGKRRKKARRSMLSRDQAIEVMQEILALSRRSENWPSDWPQWEMREVEHTLCEFDKYCRIQAGEGKTKEKFAPRTIYLFK